MSALVRLLLLASVACAAFAWVRAEQPALKRVAIVLDDGPVAGHREQYLALFARAGVKVTFSNVGQAVDAQPALARAAAEAGHDFTNHSYSHPRLKELDDAGVTRELREAQLAFERATGRKVRWAWAPFLQWDERIAALARPLGLEHFPLPTIKLVSTNDWQKETDATAILKNATSGIVDRTVLLGHEWRAETLAQMPAILEELKRQGCTFVTFSELAAAP